MIIGLQGQKV